MTSTTSAEQVIRTRTPITSQVIVLAVLSTFPDGAAGEGRTRTIHTLHYVSDPQPKGPPVRTDELVERGTVPLDRIDRIIEGVLHRLDVPGVPPPAASPMVGVVDYSMEPAVRMAASRPYWVVPARGGTSSRIPVGAGRSCSATMSTMTAT